MKKLKMYFLFSGIVAVFALPVSLSFAIGIRPANPCVRNVCNPCAKKTKNPCNPCVGKVGNVCNPCAAKMRNPCNPCGGKMKNICNPCGKKDVRHIRTDHITDYSELVAIGKKLWSDEKLGTNGLTCMNCHEDYELLNLNNADSFPHYIEMANDILTLDQMINFCLINPMEGEKLDPELIEITAIAAYYHEYKKIYKKSADMSNPCVKKMKNPCNPCAKKTVNVCNPCGNN